MAISYCEAAPHQPDNADHYARRDFEAVPAIELPHELDEHGGYVARYTLAYPNVTTIPFDAFHDLVAEDGAGAHALKCSTCGRWVRTRAA
jgi:hypothetical protein